MALDFPSNPTPGTVYQAPNDVLYVFDGTKWVGSVQVTEISSNLIPADDLAYDLGENVSRWRTVFASTMTLYGTQTSTSTTTGALVIAGGVGVGGSLYVGGPVYSQGIRLTVLEETFETKNTVTGVTVHDCTTNRLFYLTNVSGNFTPNLTNLNLASGEATSISIVVVQTSTARSISEIQIAGTTTGVVLSWQGSISAPSGNASRTEVFTFRVLCTGSNAYTVLGMMTSFGGV